MDLYGRPAPRRTSPPTVAFLNEKPKPLSVSSGLKQPSVLRGRTEDKTPTNELPDRPSSNQLQQQQPPSLHHRPASSRFLNRPRSSGVRRPEPAFAVFQEVKQRSRTARESVRTSLATQTTFAKKTSCFVQETETTTEPEALSHNNRDERTDPPLSLDKKYLEQLKADILHLHHAHQQLEKESRDRSAVSATQAPNHVKNLLLNRDTKAYLGWSSQHELELNADSGISQATTAILHTQLLRYNYSSDPAQLAAAKIGLEGLLSDTLISLMEFCLNHDSFDHNGNEKPGVSPDGLGANSNIFRMKLIRPQRHSDALIPFANGCGTSSVSIYVGGILSVLQQTEIMKRVMLASTGERKVLIKAITDKDARLGELTEQLSFFKDALARRRPRLERSWKAQIPVEERVLVDTPESTDIEDTSQSKLDAQKEQLARLTTLEKEKVESILLIQNLEGQKDELEQQLEKANFELRAALERLKTAEQLQQESISTANFLFQEQVQAMEKRAADLHSSLTSTVERYRLLEDSTTQEKTQLRRDKQELERLIRLKEEEAGQRQVLAIAKAEAKAQSATAQLESVMKQLDQAQQALVDLRRELKAAQTDNKQIQGTIRSLHNDMKVRNEDVERLTSELSIATTAAESKAVLLQQSEARIEASAQEIKRQQALLDEQAHQVQLLEAKLSRSVPVDDEELLSRQQREESAWHQRVSALEHALVAERQNTSLFRDQQRKAVAMEQEKAAHAMEQAQAVAAELATANLCLLERKRQREQEQHAFDAKLKEYADRIVQLTSDKDALKGDSDTLRSQHEQLRQRMERGAEDAATAKNKMQEELAVVKDELKNLMEIRENIDRALAHALASPRGRSARHQASLSEVRVELQKAKQKIAVLEDQLSRNGLIRKSEIDGKLAQLSARERRVTEEQRGLKKQRATERLQIEKERAELEQQREDQAAAESKHKIDHDLLKQIIVLLAQRLKILVALFDTESMSCSSHDEGAASGTAEAGSPRPPSENVETWRGIQQQWKALHQGLEDADWKLVDMRSRLEALHLEYLGQSMPPLEFTQQPPRSALLPGFHGPNPFSDAVAAGRDTVPVADKLKASRLLRRLSCPGESLESRARQVKPEEHETFALALAREMTAMKESYERQLEELRGELRKTQQLRRLASQRLRAELATQRNRSQSSSAQLSERIAELEAALAAQEEVLAATRLQHQAVLDRHAAATSDDERLRALRELAELVGSEQRLRERERLSKLLTYCGASSVTVERRDAALEEETVDAVLEQIASIDVDAATFSPK